MFKNEKCLYSRGLKFWECILAWWRQKSWYHQVLDGLIYWSLDKICKLIPEIYEEHGNTAPQKHCQSPGHWVEQPQDFLTASPSAMKQRTYELEEIKRLNMKYIIYQKETILPFYPLTQLHFPTKLHIRNFYQKIKQGKQHVGIEVTINYTLFCYFLKMGHKVMEL